MTDPHPAPGPDTTEASAATGVVDFGQFRFDLGTGELWRDGHALRLAPKPAQVLAVLVRSAGSLVTRRTIELQVWGDVPIDLDRSVNFAIRQIRSALGDSADAPLYIETLPKRGYRFIAPVGAANGPGSSPDAEIAPKSVRDGPAPTPPSLSRRLLPFAVVLIIATGIGVLALDLAGSGSRPASDTGRTMLAVLPLESRDSGDDHDYFASGLTDEIIARLARLDPNRLGVIARTSSRRVATLTGGSDSDVAARLSADYVLRGTVTPTGADLRVTMRLTSGEDGTVLWAERYQASIPTSPDLEFEIAARVGEALRDEAVPELAKARPPEATPSPAARDALLRGSWLSRLGPDRREQAVALVREAIDADSTYGPAWAALGSLLLSRDRRLGVEYLQRAVALTPTHVPAHVSLGRNALYWDWDMEAAGEHFRRALELEPGNVLSHHPYAYYLSIAGLHEDAMRHIETALDLDPVSPLVNGDVGRIYYRARRFEEAKRQCRRTIELAPGHEIARSCLLNIAMLEGDPAAALPHARFLLGTDSLALDDAADPMRTYFEMRRAEWKQAAESGQNAWVALAQAHIFLGERDKALSALEQALANGSPVLPQVPGDPCFGILAGDPRFESILQQMGIP